ncbi:hypothetical protein ACWDRB_43955 [Nonomuraea sp. NPDC003707]
MSQAVPAALMAIAGLLCGLGRWMARRAVRDFDGRSRDYAGNG